MIVWESVIQSQTVYILSYSMIQLAFSPDEIEQCFSVMSQLRPHLKSDNFIAQIEQQRQLGYRLAYITEEEEIMGVAGFKLATSLSWGKYLYVADLVVDENHRSKYYGEMLFKWLIQYAKDNSCQQLHLDSGVQRFAAHRFYFRQKMSITGHHFALQL